MSEDSLTQSRELENDVDRLSKLDCKIHRLGKLLGVLSRYVSDMLIDKIEYILVEEIEAIFVFIDAIHNIAIEVIE
jgi:hypothetical protein